MTTQICAQLHHNKTPAYHTAAAQDPHCLCPASATSFCGGAERREHGVQPPQRTDDHPVAAAAERQTRLAVALAEPYDDGLPWLSVGYAAVVFTLSRLIVWR